MIQTIPLAWPAPPLSLNDRGKHWGARYRKEKLLRDEVFTRARAQKIKAVDAAVITLHWRPAVKRARDADNQMLTLKPCIDALVRAGVLPSDDSDVVEPRVVIHAVIPGKPGATWITIEDMP